MDHYYIQPASRGRPRRARRRLPRIRNGRGAAPVAPEGGSAAVAGLATLAATALTTTSGAFGAVAAPIPHLLWSTFFMISLQAGRRREAGAPAARRTRRRSRPGPRLAGASTACRRSPVASKRREMPSLVATFVRTRAGTSKRRRSRWTYDRHPPGGLTSERKARAGVSGPDAAEEGPDRLPALHGGDAAHAWT